MNSYELNQELLMSLNSNSNDYCAVFISCVEIYNNYIYDLLDESGNKESKYLKEDTRGCMYIKDIAELQVRSSEEALDLLQRAQKRRVVAYTDLNAESSRSHSIFTIRFVQLDQNMQVLTSQLSLVDLAGSERTKRTKNTGSRLKEAGSINSSLMALRNCMETLRENISNSTGQRKMVPYRDSKLTLLFKNYFEGNGKIKMILCINPSSIEFDETIVSFVFVFSQLFLCIKVNVLFCLTLQECIEV
jgi:kinesin family protein 23